ncbi:MAG: glycosyltransferase family 9 protein [Acidobacteriota bacterium]
MFTTPAVAALRRRFPSAEIVYLVEQEAEPIVRQNPHLDRVIAAARPRGLGRFSYDLRLAWQLRRERFDVVVDFHGGPRSAWLTAATGARRRLGYAVPWRQWAYTELHPWTPSLVPPRHSVVNQWDLAAMLGVPPAEVESTPVAMTADGLATARVDRRLADAGVPPDAAIVVVHVSAGNPFRRWPPAHFATAIAALARRDSGRRIIITSGPSEQGAALEVATQARGLAGHAGEGVVTCGEFDLSELRALVGRAALYIGGDSGPLHVAATSRVPIVAIFGPTLPGRSMPWRGDAGTALAVEAGPLPCRPCHQRRCEPGDFRCLTRIEPGRVVEAAERLLSSETHGP